MEAVVEYSEMDLRIDDVVDRMVATGLMQRDPEDVRRHRNSPDGCIAAIVVLELVRNAYRKGIDTYSRRDRRKVERIIEDIEQIGALLLEVEETLRNDPLATD